MLKRVSLEVSALLLIAGLFWWFLVPTGAPAEQSMQTIEATPAPILINTPLTDLALESPIKVYSGGQKTKKDLKLPTSVVKDESKQVIAGTKIDVRDDHPRTVTTVIDAATGESTTYITKEPLPWITLDSRGSAGLYAGYKNGEQVARLQLQQSIIQIKAVHIGALATIDQPISGAGRQDYFIGVGAEYHW